MSDLKLFRTTSSGVAELPGGAMALEKSLQTLFEANLEALLGVRFLASEFVTNEGGSPKISSQDMPPMEYRWNIDDLLATGGTAAAAAKLVESIGGKVAKLAFVIELGFLKGREKLKKRNVFSLIQY